MLAIKTPLAKAQTVKKALITKDVLDNTYKIIRDDTHCYFPVKKRIAGKYVFVSKRGKKRVSQNKGTQLEKVLTKQELASLRRSFDMVGTVAILEIPDELVHKEKEIAKVFLEKNNIQTVLKKAAFHGGTFRTQKMKYLAGIKTKEALHKENGTRIKVDVEKVYFSVRLAEERKRIAGQVKKGENILIMFSGAAPYPIVLSKNTLASEIVGVEINPTGHKYGLENIKLNKVKNVRLYCGDVRKVVPTLHESFDRIVMPLPKTADDFLNVALDVAKKGAIINFYSFQNEKEFDKATQIIKKECKKKDRTCTIKTIRKVGQQSPYVYRICVDFKVN